MNFDSLIKVSKMGVVRGLPRMSRLDNSLWKSCWFGKQTRTHFKSKDFSSFGPLELIHIDIFGQNREKT